MPQKEMLLNLHRNLSEWGIQNIVFYPWRYRDDPYLTLVSEFMLHRTQTRQVVPVFIKFIEKFPTLISVYEGERLEIDSYLITLGLSWRISNMIDAFKQLWESYQKVPDDYQSLVNIRGIGTYIASATICFTWNRPMTLVDSNIVRVIGRIYGLDLSGEARRRKVIIEAITNSIDTDNPREFYYAIIDLAHNLCRPKSPVCQICPLQKTPCNFGITN